LRVDIIYGILIFMVPERSSVHAVAPERLRWSSFTSATSPVYIADTFFTGPGRTASHCHDFFEFFLVVRGRIRHFRNTMVETLPERSVCFVAPNDTHSFQNDTGQQESGIINVAFPRIYMDQCLRILGVEREAFLRGRMTLLPAPSGVWQNLSSRVVWLQQEQGNRVAALEVAFKGLLAGLVSELWLPTEDQGTVQGPEWLVRACNEMQQPENFSAGLRRFIRLSGKSQEHLTRTLRAMQGVSPTEYINKLRLQKAGEELLSTNKQVIAIAYDAGFENIPHFNQLFKRMFGVSPRAYRALHAKVFGRG